MRARITRGLAAVVAAAAIAGCASVSQPVGEVASVTGAAGALPSLDPTAKRRIPDRERGGDRERARPNAKYNLDSESDENGPPSAAQLLRAQAQRKAIERPAGAEKLAGLQPSQWQSLGPGNVGGRVRAMAFDPRNAKRLFAGAATGGLWISDDAGLTWRANSDFLPNLSITAIVFDPADSRNVYIGTGEASQGFVGVGVFKSTDGGSTFRFLDATNVDLNSDWRFVNRLAIHPAQPQVLLAGVTNNDFVTGGVYRTADGGATWAKVSSARALDIAFGPDGNSAIAGLDDGTILYSRDAGQTWQHTAALVAAPSSTDSARAEIAFARSLPGVAYASIDNAKGEVWRSSDGGATWTKMSTPGHLNVQGNYDNTIWVDPTDGNHVLVGGLDVYESIDGGATFNKVSDWTNAPSSPHADHHQLVSPPNFGSGSSSVYDGNDGGIYRADNVYALSSGTVGLGWTNLNGGLAVTQFYSGAGFNPAGGRIIGGTQDNGSLSLQNGQWQPFRGGDGGFVAVDPRGDQTIYGEYIYLAIHRSLNGGFSSYICNGITEGLPNENGNTYCGANATKKANFIAPFILDPNNPDRMLAGANSLWVTDTARTTPAWRTIKAPSAATDNFINAIAVQEGNGNVIWVGHNNGEIYRTADGLSAAPTWTRVGASAVPGRRVMRILVDRDNANRVIVALTGFVPSNLWQTLDGGNTWASITGNLPNAPIFDVKRHPANGNWLYVATSVGVFTSENGGQSWSTTNEGPANIRVRELFWLDNATLGAATFGRGMFKIALGAANVPNYQDLWWAGQQENGWGMSIAQHGSTLFSAMYVYDASGQPVWVVMPGGSWNADRTAFSGPLFIPSGSWFGNYDTSRFVVGNAVGNATLAFAGTSNATLSYTINGVAGTKAIQRQLFGPVDPTPMATYTDLWWGGTAQNGWGIAINQQYRTIFAVWYTYDASGKTVWYVVPGGTWTASNVYTGTAYRTTSSPWLGSSYNAAAFSTQAVGTVTLTFTDLNNAVMSYTIDGVSGSKPVTRQPF